MECKFEVGQKVVCIDDSPTTYDGDKELNQGDIYTISWVGPEYNPYEKSTYIGVKLKEIPHRLYNNCCIAFRWNRFKPLEEKKTDISIFQTILNRVNEKKVLDEVH